MNGQIIDNLNRQTDRQTELSNCTFVKTVLMLLVVFYHSILFWKGNWFALDPIETSVVLTVLADWLNSFHIYGFAMISGYIFFFIKYEKGGYAQFVPFVANKAKRLLLPYAVVASLWAIPIHCAFFKSSLQDIVTKYVLATSPSQLWFIVMLFDVFVIFWLLSDFCHKHDLVGAILILVLYGIGLVGGGVIPDAFMVRSALLYLPVFWLGFKLRQYGTDLIRKIPAVVWVVADILLFAGMQYLPDEGSAFAKVIKLGMTFLVHIVGAIMAFVVLQKAADLVKWDRGLFAFLSKRTMIVYLLHQQIIYITIYLLNGVINPYLNAMINFVVAMVISLAIATIMLKFKFTRLLMGEK